MSGFWQRMGSEKDRDLLPEVRVSAEGERLVDVRGGLRVYLEYFRYVRGLSAVREELGGHSMPGVLGVVAARRLVS